MAKLIVERGRNKGQVFELLADNTTLGREKYNTIRIEDESLSKSHCLIERQGHSYYLKDLSSTNGTFLNQQPITEIKLTSGDKIGLGDTILIFRKDKREERKGMNTITDETSKEMKRGKGYATLLSESVKEVKNHDLSKAVKKAGKSGGFLKQILQGFGWSKTDADKLASESMGKKGEDFPPSLIIEVSSPKVNEHIIKARKRLEGIENGNIVGYQGKDYLILEIKEDPAGTFIIYRLKEC